MDNVTNVDKLNQALMDFSFASSNVNLMDEGDQLIFIGSLYNLIRDLDPIIKRVRTKAAFEKEKRLGNITAINFKTGDKKDIFED